MVRRIAAWVVSVGLLFVTGSGGLSAAEPIPAITRLAVYSPPQAGSKLLSPLSLARDPRSGDLIVTSFESGQIVFLNDAGAVIKTLGVESGLRSPYGVAVDAGGRLLVSEVHSGLLKILSPAGVLMEQIDLSAVRGHPVSPGRITVGPRGRIHLVDLAQKEILVLSPEGQLLRSYGPLDYPQKAGATGNGQVIGLSAQGSAVSLFDADGSAALSFGEHGGGSTRHVSFPTGFAIDARNRLWIADAFQHRLKVFALDGTFLFNYGKMEDKRGGFFFPVDLCFDAAGRLFVLEKGAERIQVFRVEDLVKTPVN